MMGNQVPSFRYFLLLYQYLGDGTTALQKHPVDGTSHFQRKQ